MNDHKRDESNLERRQDLLEEEETFRLQQEENRLGTARRSNTYFWIVNSIYWFAGLLQTLLILRFLLRLFGANPQNEFAQMINNLSAPFIAPFSTLFISPTSAGGANIFDLNIAIAIIAYALLSYLAISLVRFIFYNRVV
jgi:YggT family protein